MRNLNWYLFTAVIAAMCCLMACSKVIETPRVADTEPSVTTQSEKKETNETQSSGIPSTPTVPATPITPATPGVVCCKTEHVIIVVIDGPRFSETWGDYTRQYIPQQSNLLGQAVVGHRFYNNGSTLTDPGHLAITTGVYENIDNFGDDIPETPSIFQEYLKSTGKPADKAWIVTSKGKLEILANSKADGWRNKYMPRTDCGPSGIYSGYRSDSVTMERAKNIIEAHHPNLMLVNFKDPDYYAHSNLWSQYIKGIQTTDQYIRDFYDLIQNDPEYKGKTTLIVTNDHGRHSDGISTGFVDHGCSCDGCKRIQFFAIGPDFKKYTNVGMPYELIDISKTVGKLLNFNTPYSKGKVMTEMFN